MFNARIQLKHDTELNWKNTTNFIPMIGEMIIYDADDNYNYERFKIGDGVRNVNELPFSEADWNAAEGEAGYISNKPTYKERKTLLSSATILPGSFEGFENAYQITDTKIRSQLSVGKIYIIEYNSVEYKCECKKIPEGLGLASETVVMGNFSVIGGENTGEPFAMAFGETGIGIIALGGEPYVVKIYEDIQYLEPKNIPDMYYWEEGEVILPEYTGTYGGYVDNVQFDIPGDTPLELVENEFYIVTINGKKFKTKARKINAMGNIYFFLGTSIMNTFQGIDDIQFPFTIWAFGLDEVANSGKVAEIMFSSAPANYTDVTVSISKMCTSKIPNEYLPEDLPHIDTTYKFTDTLTPTNKTVYINGDIYWTQVSSSYIKRQNIYSAGCTFTIEDQIENQIVTKEITSEDIVEEIQNTFYIVDNKIYFFAQETLFDNFIFPKGIYFRNVKNEYCVKELKAPGEVFEVEEEVVYKLNSKYLPEGVPFDDLITLLPETYAEEFNHDTFGTMYRISAESIPFVIGEEYKIKFNGIFYNCICQPMPEGYITDPNAVAFGNFSVIGGIDSGEPFAIMASPYLKRVLLLNLTDNTTVKLGIYKREFKKLDGKFLPEGVPYSEGEYKEILPEYQWENTNVVEDGFIVPGTTPLDIVENEFYTVNWNGIEYNCQAIGLEEDGMKMLFLGNLEAITGGAVTGEPFVIGIASKEMIADSGSVLMGMPLQSPFTNGTLSIYKSKIIHKLDNKYLNLDWIPEDIKVSLIPKASIECTYPQSNGSYSGMYVPSLPVFEDKQEVLVIFNDQKYKCKISKTPYMTNYFWIYIGNKYLGNSNEENTEEPFCIYGNSLDGFALYTTTPGVHTIEICTTKPNKLPDRYLNLDWLLASSKEIIIEETKVVASESLELIGESGFKVEFEGTFDVGIGEKDIFVCYDGIEYEAKYAANIDGTYISGKNSLLIDNEFILANSTHGNSMLFTKTPGAHTISVYFRKISEKYLSDNLVTEDELVASDWEANSEEPGHILNRPFFTEDSEYVLEEIPINGEWDGDTRYDFISPLNLAIGETYIVNWDGVDYTVVGKAYKENNILTCVSLGGESEHPFFIFGESGYNGNDACAYGTKCSFTISRMVNTNILKPTIINFNESVGMIYEKSLPLNIGDTYIVYWNGIGYPCVAQDLDGAVGLGNGVYNGYQGNEEPFFIVSEPDLEDVRIFTYDARAQEQIRLFIDKKEPKHKVHKLDNKYLNLDWIPSGIEVNKILAYPYYYHNYHGIEGFEFHLDYKHQPFMVICDGVSYQTQLVTTKINGEFVTYCGNRAILDGEKDTGEPFVGWLENADLVLRFTDVFTHQISIITTKNKMPLNYLPESVFEIMDSTSIIVQDDEPYNVPDGTLWLDTDAQGAVSGGFTMEEIVNSVIAALPNAEEVSF